AARSDIAIVARMIEPPDLALLDTVEIILARPPFSLDEEIATLKRHQIEILVTKNAGGDAVAAKLEAARRLGLPVIMIDRPTGQPPVDAENVAGMVALLEHHFT
ncbi:MAG: precorrin-6A/cobalt-precorrin-6A reductase, partial [Hyphomicrobiaceae bacterium]